MKFYRVGPYTLALLTRVDGLVKVALAVRREGSVDNDKQGRATAALRLRQGRFDVLTRLELKDIVDKLMKRAIR